MLPFFVSCFWIKGGLFSIKALSNMSMSWSWTCFKTFTFNSCKKEEEEGKEPLNHESVISALISYSPQRIRMTRDSLMFRVSPLHVSATALIHHPPVQNHHSHLQKKKKKPQKTSDTRAETSLKQKQKWKMLRGDAVTRDLAWVSFNVPVAHTGGRPHGSADRPKHRTLSHIQSKDWFSYSGGWALISWRFQ